MTQQLGTTFVRRPDDRKFRGVCAAIGRATGTDPVLWRVVVAVLTVFGGSGLLLYAAGWLVIPEEGRESVVDRLLRGRGPSRPVLLVLAVLAAVAVAGSGGADDLVPLAVVGAIAYLVLHRGPVAPPPGPAADWSAPPPLPAQSPAESSWYSPLVPSAPPTATVVPVPRRPRSPLGLLTLGAALLVVAVLVLLHGLGVPGVTASRVIAAALFVVGGGLLVGVVWGRSRLLILVALVLGVALSASAWLDPPLSLSVGERAWAPRTSSSYELGAGEATLDLRSLPAGAPADVTARIGMGHLIVLLPATPVRLVYDIRAGQVDLPDGSAVSGEHLRDDRTVGAAGTPVITLHTRLSAGELEVRGA